MKRLLVIVNTAIVTKIVGEHTLIEFMLDILAEYVKKAVQNNAGRIGLLEKARRVGKEIEYLVDEMEARMQTGGK